MDTIALDSESRPEEPAAKPPSVAPARDREGCSAMMRGMIAGVFVMVAGLVNGLWLLTSAPVRQMGSEVLLDPLATPLLVGLVLGIVGLLGSWSRFGRSILLSTALVTTAMSAFGVLLGVGAFGVVGRPGGVVPLSAWPIASTLLASLAGLVLVTGHSTLPRPLRRRVMFGGVLTVVLGIAATGVTPVELVVGGAARWQAVHEVVAQLPWALAGVMIALLALAPMRAGRTAALGQAIVALATLGAPRLGQWWWQIRHGVVSDDWPTLALAGATLVVVAVTAAPRNRVEDLEWHPPELVQRVVARLWGRPSSPTIATSDRTRGRQRGRQRGSQPDHPPDVGPTAAGHHLDGDATDVVVDPDATTALHPVPPVQRRDTRVLPGR